MDSDFTSIQAEQEILGSIMGDNEIIPELAETLTPEDFYFDRHKLIYTKVLNLYKGSQQVTAISLYETLQGSGIELSDLLALRDTTPSTNAYKTYLNIIKDYKKKRDIKEICEKAISELNTGSSSKVSSVLTEKLFEVASDKATQGIVNANTLMEKTLNFIDLAFRTKGEGVGLRTGWEQFDYATNGLAKGNMVIIGARPSMGKTAFILELVNMYASKNHACLIFEQEMTEEELGIRILGANTRTSVQKIYKGVIEDIEMDHILSESDKIGKLNKIYVDCTPSISLLEVRNRVRKLKQQAEIDVVIVDHIALMSPSDPRKDANAQITEISKGLKAIAKEYDVVLIALSQLNRGVEGRNEKRPRLSDLRESGSLEQDADLVMLLYRDNYYNEDPLPLHDYRPELLEVNIAKARNGKKGVILFDYDMSTQRIEEHRLKGEK